jgi:hypothetical protein
VRVYQFRHIRRPRRRYRTSAGRRHVTRGVGGRTPARRVRAGATGGAESDRSARGPRSRSSRRGSANRRLLVSPARAAIVQGTRTPPSHGGNPGSNPGSGTPTAVARVPEERHDAEPGGGVGPWPTLIGLVPEVASSDDGILSRSSAWAGRRPKSGNLKPTWVIGAAAALGLDRMRSDEIRSMHDLPDLAYVFQWAAAAEFVAERRTKVVAGRRAPDPRRTLSRPG